MDATPSFGATMIPEVSSNPQLTLAINQTKLNMEKYCRSSWSKIVPNGQKKRPKDMDYDTNSMYILLLIFIYLFTNFFDISKYEIDSDLFVQN